MNDTDAQRKREEAARECIERAERLEREAAALRRRAGRFRHPDSTDIWTLGSPHSPYTVEWKR